MQYAAVGLAGCMAADVVDIIRKGRHPLTALRVTFTGARSEAPPPRRFLQISLRFDIQGAVPPEAVEARHRALAREVLLRVPLVPPGHRFLDRLSHQSMNSLRRGYSIGCAACPC